MAINDHSNLEELTASAKLGDAVAMQALLRRVQPAFRAFFVSRIGHRPDVDDLVQNSLLRVHKGLQDLKDDSRLKAFAMKAAMFELQDYYRGRYTPKEALFDADDLPDAGSDDPSIAHRMDVERALSHLSEKARLIIELRENGFRYEEIAQLTDSTEAAIKMQVKRAFDRMREVLAVVLTFLILEGWLP